MMRSSANESERRGERKGDGRSQHRNSWFDEFKPIGDHWKGVCLSLACDRGKLSLGDWFDEKCVVGLSLMGAELIGNRVIAKPTNIQVRDLRGEMVRALQTMAEVRKTIFLYQQLAKSGEQVGNMIETKEAEVQRQLEAVYRSYTEVQNASLDLFRHPAGYYVVVLGDNEYGKMPTLTFSGVEIPYPGSGEADRRRLSWDDAKVTWHSFDNRARRAYVVGVSGTVWEGSESSPKTERILTPSVEIEMLGSEGNPYSNRVTVFTKDGRLVARNRLMKDVDEAAPIQVKPGEAKPIEVHVAKESDGGDQMRLGLAKAGITPDKFESKPAETPKPIEVAAAPESVEVLAESDTPPAETLSEPLEVEPEEQPADVPIEVMPVGVVAESDDVQPAVEPVLANGVVPPTPEELARLEAELNPPPKAKKPRVKGVSGKAAPEGKETTDGKGKKPKARVVQVSREVRGQGKSRSRRAASND